MLITKADTTTLEVTPLNATPIMNINYKLIERSDKKFTSIDRGEATDGYASSMVFEGEEADIDALYVALEQLRQASTQVVLSDFDENYFSDHIDHSIPINCLVALMGDLKSPMLRVKRFECTFLSTDTSYVGDNVLPSLECLEQDWSGYNEWAFNVMSTYNQSHYFADRETDAFVFTGKYRLTKEENRDLFTFWRNQRGAEFTVNDGDFGVSCMFGPNTDCSSHDVVIQEIKYEPISSAYREITITLLKTGGVSAVPPTITTQPEDQTVASGENAVFSVVAGGSEPLTYQWWKKEVVNFFEAGKRSDDTTPYPFAGSTGNPVTTDANWDAPDFGTMSYYGEYATLTLSGGLLGFCKAVHYGTPAGFTVSSTNAEDDYDVHFFGGIGTSESRGSPIVRNDMAYFVFDTSTNELILATWRGGVGTSHVVYSAPNGMTSVNIACVVNADETISYTGTAKDRGLPEASVSGTTTGTIDATKDFTAIQQGWTSSPTRTDFIRINGAGFPENEMTTPELLTGENASTLTITTPPFGDLYYCVVTNPYGTATTNEVKAIEA